MATQSHKSRITENHEGGGAYALGGTSDADLNVTWNYSNVYHLLDFHLTDLDGKVVISTIERLAVLVEKLGTEQYKRQDVFGGEWKHDYWAPTPGNAGYALNILLGWARQHPDAVWCVS